MDEFERVADEPSDEFQGTEETDYPKGFPCVRYGPDGQSAVFNNAKDVPSGWHDHPSKVKGAPDPSKAVSERRPDKAVIMKDLKRLEVPFSSLASGSDLHALLQKSQAAAEPTLGDLRRQYKDLTGKNASPKATADQLKAAIEEAK